MKTTNVLIITLAILTFLGMLMYEDYHTPVSPSSEYSACLHSNLNEPESIQPQIEQQCALLASSTRQ
jgi:hypothetical protein